ncbi:MAG: MFS transporter [Promethearchaeota archaeon]
MEQEIKIKSNINSLEFKPEPVSRKNTVFYGFGPFVDQMSHQMFQFLVFTYYYAVVGININAMAVSFAIFAIWDSINDPLIGPLTDRTKSRFGKRGFWILISLIPFALVNILLFTPPFLFNSNAPMWSNTLYMIIAIVLYDTFYSMFSVNQLALFTEMFVSEEERGEANKWKSILIIIGVIIGFVLPTIFITHLSSDNSLTLQETAKIPVDYLTTGIVIAALIVILGIAFFKHGINEKRINHATHPDEEAPGFFTMIRDTFSNGPFILFCFANLVKWFVFKLLTTIIPLYANHVLGAEGIMVSVILLSAFLVAMACFPLMKKIGMKFGWRNGFMLTVAFWILALIPFWFISNQYVAMGFMAFVGVGLSGSIYFVDPIIANLIDEDELKSGRAKAGSYYGVNGLINRYSTILVFLAMAIVLNNFGWADYLTGNAADIAGLQQGLKILMVPISIGGLIIVLILLNFFHLHGDELEHMQKKLNKARLRYNK